MLFLSPWNPAVLFGRVQYLPYFLIFKYVLASFLFNSPQLLEPVASAQDKLTSSLHRFTRPSKVSFIFLLKKQHPDSFGPVIRSFC